MKFKVCSAESVEDSGGQDHPVPTQSPTSKLKLGIKPPVSAINGALSTPSPLVQRLPAFLDNHNYAKSPMQVGDPSLGFDLLERHHQPYELCFLSSNLLRHLQRQALLFIDHYLSA